MSRTPDYPIRIHPDNHRIFEFRGKPTVLICATEHYGAVMNRPFQIETYLADTAAKKMTLTRLFVLFRELQSHNNPYSTCKPESPDYISPFQRTGPGKAKDGEPKYDLTKWNPEFFDRLHRFLSLASGYGIVVELTLFSNVYNTQGLHLNPLYAENNINGLDAIDWTEYNTLQNAKTFEWQLAHIRKIVEETNRYDNIIYEICNEPGVGMQGRADADKVNEWQTAVAAAVRKLERSLPYRHLISGQESYVEEWKQPSAASFGDFPVDIVNMHPLPDMLYGGHVYQLGEFGSKQLNLRDFRNYCLAARHERKPLNFDEDNVASIYKDPDGWTIHRKRAWTALMSGCHYDMIDFSIMNYLETGTPASQSHIRSWVRHLSEYVHSIDLVRARPLVGWLEAQPEHTLASVFATEKEDYSVYLADRRELTEEGGGNEIQGELRCTFPEGTYKAACYSPASGCYSPSIAVEGGKPARIFLSAFRHDIVVRITRMPQHADGP